MCSQSGTNLAHLPACTPLQASERASETTQKVSDQTQQTAQETKDTLADKAQQVGCRVGCERCSGESVSAMKEAGLPVVYCQMTVFSAALHVNASLADIACLVLTATADDTVSPVTILPFTILD